MDYSIPPSITGWNARDAFDNMPPTDAVRLRNLVPRETSLETRKGNEVLSDTLGGEVETLASWKGATDTDLIACYNGKIATINTSTGAATEIGTGFTNDRWQTLNINDKMVFVNGQDAPQQWDGTTLGAITMSGSGLTVADLDGVTSFKTSAIYWTQGAQEFWYAAAGAYAGTLTEFPVDFISQQGGGVMEVFPWTRDAGDGMDDLLVVLMESGETIIYQGTDFATDFEMVGRFKLGRPVSIRGSTQLGSDRVIITEDGYINLSTAISKARLNDAGNFGEKIVNEVKKRVRQYRDNYGWDIEFLPSQALLIINVPREINATPANSEYIQHVMNTNTGAWCKFTEWQSITYVEHDNQVYFGTSSQEIRRAFKGNNDDGENIEIKWIPAFNNFDSPVYQKQATFCTVVTDFYAPSYIQATGQSNFNLTSAPALRNPADYDGSLWDVSDWDTFVWAADGESENRDIKAYQIPITAFGYALTVRLRLTNKSQTPKFYSLKIKYKQARTI